MKFDSDISASVEPAVRAWVESGFSAPLVIRKTAEGLVCATSSKLRYTAGEFAEMLGLSPNTWRKRVKAHLGLAPASDGLYDAETVEWARGMMRQEEERATPHELREARKSA